MKVTIIIPAYNASSYLEKCMYYIENQTCKDFEVIFINDGSTDNTLKLLKHYQKEYGYITIINQKNKGQGAARNKAVDIAMGEYITFVDVDDFIDTTYIEEMLEVATSSKADLVYCDYYEYYSSDNLKLVKNNIHPVLANYAPWGKLYKRSFFNKTKLRFQEGKLFEDITIVPVLAGLAKTAYLPLPLYYYNMSNNSSIRKNTFDKRFTDIFEAVDETIYNFKKHKIFNKYKNEIEFIYLDSFLRGGTLRFASFKEGKQYIPKLREKVLDYFPNLLENKYYLNLPKSKQKEYNLIISMNPGVLSIFKRIYKKVK